MSVLRHLAGLWEDPRDDRLSGGAPVDIVVWDTARGDVTGGTATGADVLDVTTADRVPVAADLCTSFEVAEHLPGRHARRFCSILASAAPAVVMTAATPGQGGHLHVNEQEPGYWIDLMRQCGMAYDIESTQALKAAWRGRVAAHYHDNLLAFRRA